jgi:uncharacterized phage-associated protein
LAGISGQKIKHVDETLKVYCDKSAKELSEISHEDIPWITDKDGNIINMKVLFIE